MQIVFYGHNYGVSRAKITIRIMPLEDKNKLFGSKYTHDTMFCLNNDFFDIFVYLQLFRFPRVQVDTKTKSKRVIFKYEYEVVYFSRSCDTDCALSGV